MMCSLRDDLKKLYIVYHLGMDRILFLFGKVDLDVNKEAVITVGQLTPPPSPAHTHTVCMRMERLW